MEENVKQDDIKDFMVTLRMALLTIIRWIEKRYGLERG